MGLSLRSALATLLLAAAFVGAGYWAGQLVARQDAPEPVETELLAPSPNVVLAVQELGQLETVAFHMERVIDLKSRQRKLFGLLSADDAILLVAVGEVVAGIDLSASAPDAVEVNWPSRRVSLSVPAPAIFRTRLDSQATRVLKRSTDLLATPSAQIETRARQLAEQAMLEAALEQGILDEAQRSADRTLRSLLGSLGFQTIELHFAPSQTAD